MKPTLICCVMALCASALGILVQTQTTYFNRTSRLSWQDIDATTNPDGTPHVDEIKALEFGVVKQLDDPRFMGDGVVLRKMVIKVGEKLVLEPWLRGLEPGDYNVYARACWPDGTNGGRWCDPHPVRIDIVNPKDPSGLVTRPVW